MSHRVVGASIERAGSEPGPIREPGDLAFGALLDTMALPPETPLPVAGDADVVVAPAIAFLLRDAITGPGLTSAHVLAATESIGCGFTMLNKGEERDSTVRLTTWFTLGSRWIEPRAVPDLGLVGCCLEVDGDPVTTAAGAAVLGNPAWAVAALARNSALGGAPLEPGWIVLVGGLTLAVPLAPGHQARATFGRLGCVSATRSS